MGRMSGRILMAASVALPMGLAACGGGTANSASPSVSPCHALGHVRDEMVVRVGSARTWGPVFRGEHRYPGYADSDRLAVCLLPDGTVMGIFLKDGRQQLLWHQSPTDKIRFPI